MKPKIIASALLAASLASVVTPVYARGGGGGAGLALGIFGGIMGMAALAQQGHDIGYGRYAPRRAVGRARISPDLPVTDMSLPADQLKVVRFFYNCGRSPTVTTARAETGSVGSRLSTRFVCGDPDHPVTEFVYKSRLGARGIDRVTYFQHGKPVRIDRIAMIAGPSAAAEAPTQVRMITGEEHWVSHFWNCDSRAWDLPLNVNVGAGAAGVRTITAAVCGRRDYPVKEVFYRPYGGYVGPDTIVIKSSEAAPIAIPVIVEAARTGSAAAPASGRAATPTAAAITNQSNASPCVCDLDFEGSRVHLVRDGENLTIRYAVPKPALVAAGVRPGMVAFEGMFLPDGGVGGRAFESKKGCAPAPYAVLGRVKDDGLVLEGVKLQWNGCDAREPTATQSDTTLTFSAVSSAGSRS